MCNVGNRILLSFIAGLESRDEEETKTKVLVLPQESSHETLYTRLAAAAAVLCLSAKLLL